MRESHHLVSIYVVLDPSYALRGVLGLNPLTKKDQNHRRAETAQVNSKASFYALRVQIDYEKVQFLTQIEPLSLNFQAVRKDSGSPFSLRVTNKEI